MNKIIINKIFDFRKAESFLNNNFSSPTHWPDWNIVVRDFYGTEFFYYAAYGNEQLLGICPVHETKYGMLKTQNSGQFHFIPNGGWIFSEHTKIDESFYPVNATKTFQSFSLPIIDEFNVSYNLKNQQKYLTLLIDLKKDLDDIWKNDLNSKRRNMIRKSEKSGIKIELYDKINLDLFYRYYKDANERNNLDVHSLDFFQQLFTKSKNISFDILWAQKENKFLSAVVLIYDKNYSFYWLGLSAAHTPNLGQGEDLQWEAIKRMKEHGCNYYDLCYIQKEKLPHIYKFKKGFSKTEIPIIYHDKKSFSYRIINKIQKVF